MHCVMTNEYFSFDICDPFQPDPGSMGSASIVYDFMAFIRLVALLSYNKMQFLSSYYYAQKGYISYNILTVLSLYMWLVTI